MSPAMKKLILTLLLLLSATFAHAQANLEINTPAINHRTA